ncbi:hypothetical protein C8R42DRAFT_194033 [Lentinula raphanica]|nr:hypothetical protein C8R42DRAFT_194033 [Lentinula raphanica]
MGPVHSASTLDPKSMSVAFEDESVIVSLQEYIPQTSRIGNETDAIPSYEDNTNAPQSTPVPKLRSLVIPEKGQPTLGLLTPVEENPDEPTSITAKVIRPLPIPNSNRPRARSWADWSADFQPNLASPTIGNNHTSRPISANPSGSRLAHIAPNNDDCSMISTPDHTLEAPTTPPYSHYSESTSKPIVRASNSSRYGPPGGRYLTGRVITPQSPPHHPGNSSPESRFISRARANTTNVATVSSRPYRDESQVLYIKGDTTFLPSLQV